MCTRDLAVSTPYKFKILLSYTDGWASTTSTESVSIKLNDPCVGTVWPTQKFFDATSYSLIVIQDPLTFDLSAGYQADNETVFAEVPYFCGYPSYRVLVTKNSDSVVVYDSSGSSTTDFTTLSNAISSPPQSSTSLVFKSILLADIGVYTVKVIATIETKEVEQSTTLNI
jgi:hypothetical protein